MIQSWERRDEFISLSYPPSRWDTLARIDCLVLMAMCAIMGLVGAITIVRWLT